MALLDEPSGLTAAIWGAGAWVEQMRAELQDPATTKDRQVEIVLALRKLYKDLREIQELG